MGIGRAPGNVAGWLDASVEVRVHEDGSVQRVPWSSECTLAHHVWSNGVVGRDELGSIYVDAVLVGEGRVGTFPGRNTTAATAERKCRLLNVRGAEAVQEVSLSSNDIVVKEGVSKLSNINLFNATGQYLCVYE